MVSKRGDQAESATEAEILTPKNSERKRWMDGSMVGFFEEKKTENEGNQLPAISPPTVASPRKTVF